jgi:hypothetical protein
MQTPMPFRTFTVPAHFAATPRAAFTINISAGFAIIRARAEEWSLRSSRGGLSATCPSVRDAYLLNDLAKPFWPTDPVALPVSTGSCIN